MQNKPPQIRRIKIDTPHTETVKVVCEQNFVLVELCTVLRWIYSTTKHTPYTNAVLRVISIITMFRLRDWLYLEHSSRLIETYIKC